MPTNALSFSTKTIPEKDRKDKPDVFERDWAIAKAYWERKHRVWDYGYLNYKSILTYNNLYGQDYLRAFGLQVFVPRTFQTVEAIGSQMNSRKTEFVVKGGSGPKGFRDSERAKYFETMDNIEWKRSEAEYQKQIATKNALLYGNGYLLNAFVDETEEKHFPVLPEEDDTEPAVHDDGKPVEESVDMNKPKEIKWEPRQITIYRGMKPTSENPYYIFPDPYAKGDNWSYCYRYVIMTVDDMRAYVVQRGWMTMEEAYEKVVATQVERFDGIKDTIDTLYEQPISSKYTRGDSTNNGGTVTQTKSSGDFGGEFAALIERYESDYYEVRLASSITETMYKDWNVYPHKQIPIVVLKDNPVPDEPCGIGEPELIRWQQIEENKLHNLLMQAVMMAVVQRYAVNSTLLEDETDINFFNPFKPIRLKPMPGISVAQAVMPLPQPEVKQSPFQLLDRIKSISQATSGASDFVVSANESIADTATESNNLLAATTMRIKDKARHIEEVGIIRLAKQWHACYPFFYDEEMDFQLTGEDSYIHWMPYDRAVANENQALIEKARKELDVIEEEGQTLEDVYELKGYKQVVYISDVQEGSFVTEIRISDLEMDRQKTVDEFLKLLKVMNEVNVAAKEGGDTRRFDVFKLALEAMKSMNVIRDPSEFIMGADKTGNASKIDAMMGQPPQPGGMAPPGMPSARPGNDPLVGIRPGQTPGVAATPDIGAVTRETGAIAAPQPSNMGI